MKNRKLSSKAVISLILSAVLFTMPAVAFSVNGNYAISAFAEETKETEESKPEESTEQTPGESETDVSTEENTENSTEGSTEETTEGSTEGSTEGGTEENTEGSTDESTGDGTVSGNDKPEPVCNCEDQCGAYEYDKNCPVCVTDYKLCTYKKPNVSIKIRQPEEWHNDIVSVSFSVKDTADTGNFEIAKIEAKVGQNGSWTDVTEEKKLRISENCTVYVLVTDQKGNTYEKNRAIKCFDTVKPTLNAAVSDGLLSIQVHDTDSGAKAVYVNGYEFTDLTGGTLNIRLQQFDAGYEYFTISAMDNAGNMSEVYKTKNPYYKDPADTSDGNPAEQLPESATPTKPGSATGTVTEHTKTDSNGNTISETGTGTGTSSTKQSPGTGDTTDSADKSSESSTSEQGKEFYTIQTASEKVFYLVIDRDGDEEKVYFLTEVSENDLLNTTSDNSETLPKNSAALESAIPVKDAALDNNNTDAAGNKKQDAETVEENTEESTEEASEPETTEQKQDGSGFAYLIMGIAAAAVIGVVYVIKAKKKKENFIDDDDELEDDYEEDYDDEDGEEADPDEDFLKNTEPDSDDEEIDTTENDAENEEE